jgi:hypothetical protein
MLAAASIDMHLNAAESEWLKGHLATCPDCAGIADDYRSIHDELHSLAMPEVPRDLWARTSAALDVAEAAGHAKSRTMGNGAQPARRQMVWTAAAVGLVVVVAAVSLLSQSPISHPPAASTGSSMVALATSSPSELFADAQAPLVVVNGTSYWMSSDSGLYEIKGGTARCTASDGSCTVSTGSVQTLGSITSSTPVSAVIAPDATRAAVWTADKVVILPLSAAAPTVAIDQLTPQPSIAATPTATASASEAAAPAAPAAETPTVTVKASPSSPAASPTPAIPLAILAGYEIVGRDPEFSADGTEVAFSARPVDHSTGPDLFVWRVGQELATVVTHRHADMFAGWYGRQVIVSVITGASGTSGTGGTSYVFDPETGKVSQISRPMLLPTVDPTGRYLIFWSGTVEFDQASGLWQPGNGNLYFDAWSDITLVPSTLDPVATPSPTQTPAPPASPSPAASSASPEESSSGSAEAAVSTPQASAVPTPTATPTATAAGTPTPAPLSLPQVLPASPAQGTVHQWVVRWDAAAQHVAIWVADPGSARIGSLSLFSVNLATGFVDTNEPLLAADKVLITLSFDDAGHLVYTSAVDGKTYMQAVPAVPPSTVSTPAAPTPAEASGAAATGSPSPQTTDRPGS